MKKTLILAFALVIVMSLSIFAACNDVTYTVTFDTDGGSAIEAQTVAAGERVSKPSNPVKSGYVFNNWYTSGGNVWNFDTDTVEGDMTLYARYTKIDNSPYYTVSFDSNGGSAVASQTVKQGDPVSKPADPTRTAYQFGGWYKDRELTQAYNFSSPVDGEFTLYAKWNLESGYVLLTINYGSHADTAQIAYKPNTAFSFAPYLAQESDNVTVGFVDDDETEYLFGKSYSFGEGKSFTAVFKASPYVLSWDTGNNGWKIDGLTASGAAQSEHEIVDESGKLFGYYVRSIGDNAFARSSIVSLTLPDSVVSVGNAILAGCASLKTLSLPFVGDRADIQYGASTVMGWYFGDEYYNGCVYEKDACYAANDQHGGSPSSGVKVGAYYPASFETLEIRGGNIHHYITQYMPLKHLILGENVDEVVQSYAFYHSTVETVSFVDNTVKEIGGFAFAGTHLVELTLPNGLITIGRCAFGGNEQLVTVSMPNSVTATDGEVFSGCVLLSDVTLSEEIDTIAYNSFIGCASLKTLALPPKTRIIGPQAFEGAGLTEIELPDTLVLINARAFCFTKLTSVTLPANLEDLGNSAFWYCDQLQSVTFAGSALTYLPVEAFKNTSSLTHITIPSSVTVIGGDAFYSSGLVEITIPSSVTALGTAVFEQCNDLERVIFEDGCQISRLPDKLFRACTSLSDITIPSSVTTLASDVFVSCSSLRLLVIPSTVTTIEGACFTGVSKIRMLSPEARQPEGWSSSWNISELSVVFVGAEIRYSGNYLYAVDGNEARILAHVDGETEITVPNAIDGYAVKRIGENAFRYDEIATSVNFEEGITTIDASAFEFCDFTTLTLPESLLSIGSEAFNGCYNLTRTNLPENLETIGSHAFWGCSAIFYTKLTKAQASARWDMLGAGLSGRTIVYETGMDEAKTYDVFHYMDMGTYVKIMQLSVSLVDGVIIIPDTIDDKPVVEIGDQAFANVEAYAIYFPASVTVFGKNCFSSRRMNLAFEAATQPSSLVKECFNSTYYNTATIRFGCSKPTLDEATGLWYFTSDNKAVVVGSDGQHLDVIIPDTLGGCVVDTVGTGAFYQNKNFMSLVIPQSVTNFGNWALNVTNSALVIYCNAVDTSKFDSGWNYGVIGPIYYNVDVHSTDDFQYVVDGDNVIITHYIGSGKTVTIPTRIDGKLVTEIGANAFAVDSSMKNSPSYTLTSVLFEEDSQLVTIGAKAFNCCENLCKVYVIPQTVTSIGDSAFGLSGNATRNDKWYLNLVFRGSIVGKSSNYLKQGYTYSLSAIAEDQLESFWEYINTWGPQDATNDVPEQTAILNNHDDEYANG